tara:strand:+ start:205 stop:729 length:525 start_codon:yes stop_codon:yes gene_type:complete
MKKLLIFPILFILSCSTEPEDCAGVEGGSDVEDCAGICGGETTQEECDACESQIFDCAGECDGLAVVGGCDNTCGSNLIVDECGICGGTGEVTTNSEECSWQYICGYVYVELGANSYCTNSCMNGDYCQNSSDCYFNNGFASSCNNGASCVTRAQEYICGDEYVCIDNYITSCP